jgi:carbamate kinase
VTQQRDARRPVAVIAFGGNALLRPQDHGTQEEQFTLAWKATRWLVEIIHRGFELVIVHGNGPQVGNIMIQVEEAITKIPPQSLEVCVAQTEGSIRTLWRARRAPSSSPTARRAECSATPGRGTRT